MNRHLYRSRQHKLVGGVCGGIGEYFELDPVLVRILTVLLFMLPGVGILTYIIAWIIIPERPLEEAGPEIDYKLSPWNKYIPGILLIGFGAVLLLRTYFLYFDWGSFWAIMLIVIGGGLIVYSYKRNAFANLPTPDGSNVNGNNGESIL